ncbi:gp53-like domain-containing protein [Enterobacter roggenkampii]|uniref:gp53-like domain-containing protein n=1 Tax=Enterobacter roggenkampii TaxID=1812935 RepID=UPI00200564E6|nr:phage tail protein [Enterobacter roggenkampii]MCK6915361.1 phage tail protein [Enterobacter roggenkampii]
MALQLLAANNAQSVLAAGISASATSLTLNTGTGALFPAPVSGTSFFKLTLIDAATGQLTEIVHVTARTGDTLTIDRAQEGTLARAWSANDIVANMMTAGTLSYIMSNLQPLDATLTALAGLATGANKLPYFTGTDTASQTDLTSVGRDIIGKNTIAEILTYLTLKSAAQRDVGTGTNQIPDMNSFVSGAGWMKFPSGRIIQYGYHTSSSSGSVIINFPIPFPTQCFGVTGAGTDAGAANIAGCQVIDKYGFYLSAWLVAAGSVFNRTATNISWIAVGI